MVKDVTRSAPQSVTLSAVAENILMQSSELAIEPAGLTAERGWLENFNMAEKLPMALAFGCLLGLSSPGFDLSFLAWIGLVPLLVLLRAANGRLEASLIGLLFGLGYHLVGLSCYLGLYPLRWLGVDDIFGIQAAAAVWFLESTHEALLFMAFALMIFCLPIRAGFVPYFRRPFFPYLFSIPLVWLFLQWTVGTSEFFISLPVNQLAYSQHANLPFIQAARFGGSGLIDFLIVLTNAAVAQLVLDFTTLAPPLSGRVDQFSKKVGATIDFLCIFVVLMILNISGRAQISDVEFDCHLDNPNNYYRQTPSVPVALVQGNVTIEEDRLKTTSPEDISKRYMDLSTNLGVGLVVYPEGLLNASQTGPGLLLGKLRSLSGTEKKEILVGSIESLDQGRVNAGRIISYLPTKDVLYVKQRLVPFGEFAPLGSVGKDFSDRIGSRVSSSPEQFLRGQKTHLLQAMWGKVGVSICAEIIYPHIVSTEVRRGANLLVNMSNLGWFHASSLNRQMLAASVFRAIENGRYVVVASNTGISAVIDPAGMVKSQSLPGRRGVILDTVQFLYTQTPFSRMWWL
jgi:apolipoprotein N-acyltransferase